MWNACGNIRLVTRTCVVASLRRRVRHDAHAVVGRLDLDLRPRDARASSASSACRNRSTCRGTAGRRHRPDSSSWKNRCRNEVCAGSMPTSSDCSQLQSMRPLNAKVWVDGRDEAVEMRERRRLARPHIGEQDAALLHHRIGLLADARRTSGCPPAPPASPGSGRRHRTASRGTRSADRRSPAGHRRDRCRDAGRSGRSGRSGPARPGRSTRSSPSSRTGLIGRLPAKFVDQRRRLPIAPHQRARGRAGTDARDEIVLFLAQHAGLLLRRSEPDLLYDRPTAGSTHPEPFQAGAALSPSQKEPIMHKEEGRTVEILGRSPPGISRSAGAGGAGRQPVAGADPVRPDLSRLLRPVTRVISAPAAPAPSASPAASSSK